MIIWFSETLSMMLPVDEAVDYLVAHPILLALLVLVLVGIIVSLVKKVLKAALILVLIFVAANALVITFADTEWGREGKRILDQGRREAEKVVNNQAPKLLEEGAKKLGISADSVLSGSARNRDSLSQEDPLRSKPAGSRGKRPANKR